MKTKQSEAPVVQFDPKTKRLWVKIDSSDVSFWKWNLILFLPFRKMMEATASPILAGKWVQWYFVINFQ